ncbi:MAG TPA: hypothetical protein VID68_14630 [Solirubrobacteraceae bacterium]
MAAVTHQSGAPQTAAARRRRGVAAGPPADGVARRRSTPPAARIRWDRVGRVAMLVTLVALLYLAISPIRSLIADFQLSAQRRAQVQALEVRYAQLQREQRALSSPRAPALEARNLGLLRHGEHGYVVYGLPNN